MQLGSPPTHVLFPAQGHTDELRVCHRCLLRDLVGNVFLTMTSVPSPPPITTFILQC